MEVVVIGASAGGLAAVSLLLEELPAHVRQPLVLAQHRGVDGDGDALSELLRRHTDRPVVDPDDKTPLEPGSVYLAPPDYHLLLEPGQLVLSTEGPVQFARPSVDVLFESAAEAYGAGAAGVVLTGANADGAAGLARIRRRGGVAIVQDPETALARAMPEAALATAGADAVLPLERIPAYLGEVCGGAR